MRHAALAALVALAVTACSDDDDPSGPSGAPGVPATVAVTVVSPTAVRVTWDAVTGATAYVVERAAGNGGFVQVATPTVTTFDDTGLEKMVEYQYRVSARNSVGSSAASSTVRTVGGVREVTENITTNTTWTSDWTYLLKGFIKVANGARLTIQAGTLILGDYNTLGSSLFVLRGAQIDAQGTATNPIVFTSSRQAGQRQPGDWGGLIIVGNARINRGSPVILEGTGTSAANPQVDYSGGTVDTDNSGILRYVRVEFAGYATAQDAELNSFTIAAVGSGTTMEYLQAIAGLDDHFEWFGGTADAKYLVSYESGDDHFDMSEGFSGRLQHLIALQTRILQPRAAAGNVSSDPQGIENDGCNGANCLNGEDSQPLTLPLVANFTLVGTGPGVVPNATSGVGMVLRRGTGGYYVNGHVTRWPNGGVGLRNTSATGVATQTRINEGNLVLRNVLVSDAPAFFEGGTNRLTVDLAANVLEFLGATPTTPMFAAFAPNPTSAASYDWTPSANAPQRQGGTGAFTGPIAAKAGTAVQGTTYRGAADPNGPKWWQGWTVYVDN